MLHWLVRPHRAALAAAAGLVLVAPASPPLAGQATSGSDARLQGVVLDQSSYQPVDSATVSLLGTDMSTAAGKLGSFAFPDAPLGRVSMRVSAPGHPSVTQDVEVTEGGIMYVQVLLPSVAATLQELLVQTGRRARSDHAGRTAADLLADEVPRMRVSPGIVGKTDYNVTLRSVATLEGDSNPLILIDGVLMARSSDAYDALNRIPASDVESIQVLKGPDAYEYPYAANGVVKVTTKRGHR